MKKTPWTISEDRILIERYANTATSELLELLPGRKIGMIYQHARILGLKKSDEFLKSEAAGRIQKGGLTPGQVRNQFKKGHKPWNAGIDYKAVLSNEAIEGMAKTQFKKGARPVTAHAPGTIFPIKDSKGKEYLFISMEGRSYMPYHVYLWIEVHGPVPKGCVIRFKDGNQFNCVLENLLCLTRSENMKMNSYHRYGKEIAGLIQLRGALTRQINKLSKDTKHEK